MLNDERRTRWVTGLLPALAGGLAMRVWYFLDLKAQPFFGYPLVDSLTFDRLAREILAGGGGEAFFRAPLYPLFLSFVYALAGAGQTGAVWAQFVLGLAAVVPVYLLAARWFGRPCAVLTAWIVSLYPLRIFFEGELLAVTLFGFLLAWGTWLLWTGSESGAGGRMLLSGPVLGLAVLTRPNALVAAGFLLAGSFALGRDHPGRHARRLLTASCLLALTVAPATVHNWKAERRLIPVAANGGINFYLGNRPGATGETPLPPGLQWYDTVQEPIRLGLTGMWEQDRYWWGLSMRGMAEDPLGWLALVVKKSLLFWNAIESSNNKDLDHFTSVSFPVRHYRGWFGLLACLAAAGLPALRGRRPFLPLLSLLAGYTLAVVLFFVSARYRLPLVPFLAMAASAAAVDAVRQRGRTGRRYAAATAALLLAAAVVFPPWFNAGQKVRVDPDFQMGQVFLGRGEPDKAETHLLRALRKGTGSPDLFNSLGAVSFARQEWAEAERYYHSALEYGDYSEVHFNLGVLYERMGPHRKEEALASYRRALRRNPLESRARANLEHLLGTSRP